MGNLWKNVWNNKKSDEIVQGDEFTCYSKLKRLDGFDVNVENEDEYYRSFYEAFHRLWNYIYDKTKAKSVFEIGCGSGPNLYLLQNKGIIIGGVDYSSSLIEKAKEVLRISDVFVGEAIETPLFPQYDILLSDSVFAYFQDVSYGEQVLEKMYEKAKKAIVLLELFDKDMENECISYRRNMMENYDELYKGLDKVFYPKELFIKFAREHDCDIEFTQVSNQFYWNSKYMYNCFLYKKLDK